MAGGLRHRLEPNILRALPQRQLPHLAQLLAAALDGEKVVAGELAELAGELACAVREEDLGLAVATRIKEDLAGGRVARRVLEADAELILTQRYPTRLPAPSRMNELLLIG